MEEDGGLPWNRTARCAAVNITNGQAPILSATDCAANLTFVCEVSIRNVQESIISLEQGVPSAPGEYLSYYADKTEKLQLQPWLRLGQVERERLKNPPTV